MLHGMHKLSTCLWFDDRAEEAARFYCSVFEGGKIVRTTHYTEAGKDVHGRPPGSVLTVEVELAGNTYVLLNGGPEFHFNEAMSIMINCDTQAEIDYYVNKLAVDQGQMQCGWLKDKFGVSWQVTPKILADYLADRDRAKAQRVMTAMMKMKKLDIALLERAASQPPA